LKGCGRREIARPKGLHLDRHLASLLQWHRWFACPVPIVIDGKLHHAWLQSVRDYIHVSDLVRAHAAGLRYLRAGGTQVTLSCGYGHGFSVREVIEMVKRVSGVDFKVESAPRRPGDPAQIIAASDRDRDAGVDTIVRCLATIIAHAGSRSCDPARSTEGRLDPNNASVAAFSNFLSDTSPFSERESSRPYCPINPGQNRKFTLLQCETC